MQIVPIIWKHGLFYAICADDAWTPRMETYYIFNYFVSTPSTRVLSCPGYGTALLTPCLSLLRPAQFKCGLPLPPRHTFPRARKFETGALTS